jgi:hypothetical protein
MTNKISVSRFVVLLSPKYNIFPSKNYTLVNYNIVYVLLFLAFFKIEFSEFKKWPLHGSSYKNPLSIFDVVQC